MGQLDGKVLVITGAGRGIGRAVALAAADEGACVVVNDMGCASDGTHRDPDVAVQVVRDIVAKGQQAVADDTDVTAPGAAAALVKRATESFGRVDGGVYSAGYWRDRSLLRMSDEDFDSVLDVHARGAFRFTRELAKALVSGREGGSIVLMSGPAAFFGNPRQVNLAAGCGATVALARTAAQELKRHGVRVSALAPTARTRLTENLPLFKSIRDDSLTPEHIVPAALYLLSDRSQDVTGELVGVAGGRVYAYRVAETTGLYAEGAPLSLGGIGDAWTQVTRS